MKRTFIQLVKFGGVGLAATAIHAAIYAVSGLFVRPAVANISGFGVAFFVSYLGHRHLTFAQPRPVEGSLMRFLIVALFGLLLNAGFVHVVTQAQLDYRWALLPMLVFVPVATFLLSKHWAFRRG